MKIEILKTSELIPYDKNPRINKNAVDAVVNSLREFGFKQPIVVGEDNIVICGHTRLKAAKKLKLKEVPCVRASDLSEDQIRAYRIADNFTASLAEWDMELLAVEVGEISLDMTQFGLEPLQEDEENHPIKTDEKYTIKIDPPIYEITGEKPALNEIFDRNKTIQILEKIEKSDISEDKKHFLRCCAERHTVINFEKAAEFYAHEDKNMQALMEDNALVIIDFEKAIENNFVSLPKWFLSTLEVKE